MTNKYRTDCVYYHVEQDMGAHVSCCCKEKCFGYCPCSPDCKNYIQKPIMIFCKDCKYATRRNDDTLYCVVWDREEIPEDGYCHKGKQR